MLASYKESLRAAFLAVFYLGLGLSAYAQSAARRRLRVQWWTLRVP